MPPTSQGTHQPCRRSQRSRYCPPRQPLPCQEKQEQAIRVSQSPNRDVCLADLHHTVFALDHTSTSVVEVWILGNDPRSGQTFGPLSGTFNSSASFAHFCAGGIAGGTRPATRPPCRKEGQEDEAEGPCATGIRAMMMPVHIAFSFVRSACKPL